MIERKIIARKVKTLIIKNYISNELINAGISDIKIQKTPLGEKVIVFTSRPGVIVGKKGSNIKKLTEDLKNKFNLENPQIEIEEIQKVDLDAKIVAEKIASYLERYGSSRFKNIGHKTISNVMGAGALGIEIIISGKIPGARAKSWRFYQGYLKKCGDMAVTGIKKANVSAKLKSGIIGIRVSIMPKELMDAHSIELLKIPSNEVVEEIKPEEKIETKGKKTKEKQPKEKIETKEKTKTEEKIETKEKTKTEEKKVKETKKKTKEATKEEKAKKAKPKKPKSNSTKKEIKSKKEKKAKK